MEDLEGQKKDKKQVKTVGNYQMIEELSSGAEGGTYLCQDKTKKGSILCAKKINRDDVEKHDSQFDNMVQEMEALIPLRHPNIIRISDIVSTRSAHYIIMDYCNATNLYDLIEHRTFLRESEVHFIVKQIVEAFLYLTEKDILHRDLKPHNIMLHF